MITIEIHNDENVRITTDEEGAAEFLDNKGHVKNKFLMENGTMFFGSLEVFQDIKEWLTSD